MDLPDLIRTERAKRNWSQRDLARALKISHGAVAQWENGMTKPKPVNILDMLALFGVSAEELTSPHSPYFMQFVDDPEEVALLTAWRRLKPQDRGVVLRMLGGAGAARSAPSSSAPQTSGKNNDV